MATSYKLEKDKYVQYLFSKHHVVPGFQAKDFEEVINSVVGVHSARLPSPYVAFHARIKNIVPADYRVATNLTNKLIKLRCMRKTLHTVTQSLAPIVHTATLELRTSELRSHLKNCKYSLENAAEVLRKVLQVSLVSPRRHIELLKSIADYIRNDKPRVSIRTAKRTARLLLKWLWETGQICYINQATHWSNEVRVYGTIHHFYPSLQLNILKREEAVRQLVFRYIQAFGPVSEKDIAWWSGIRMSELREALNNIKRDLIRVNLRGVADNLIMMRRNFDEYLVFSQKYKNAIWCAFLAYEDPTLKGYFDTRERYVDLAYYDKLFNQIGEARPSIVLNGNTIGTWCWDKKANGISIKTFRALSNKERVIVFEKRSSLEEYLNENRSLN